MAVLSGVGEVLSSDPIAIAQEIAGTPNPGKLSKEDKAFRRIVRQYLDATAADLALGIAKEPAPPAVPLQLLNGDPAAFLEGVPAPPRGQ